MCKDQKEIYYFFLNLTAVNIVFKTSSGFTFINQVNKIYDSLTSKIEIGNKKVMPMCTLTVLAGR
jgi:hypothetical protein